MIYKKIFKYGIWRKLISHEKCLNDLQNLLIKKTIPTYY